MDPQTRSPPKTAPRKAVNSKVTELDLALEPRHYRCTGKFRSWRLD